MTLTRVARGFAVCLALLLALSVAVIPANAAPQQLPAPANRPKPVGPNASHPPQRALTTQALKGQKAHVLKKLPKGTVKAVKGAKTKSIQFRASKRLLADDENPLADDGEMQMAQVASITCYLTLYYGQGPTTDGYPTVYIEGDNECDSSPGDSGMDLQVTSIDYGYLEWDSGFLDGGASASFDQAFLVGPFDWGTSHDEGYFPQVVLPDPSWQWTSVGQGCWASGITLNCAYSAPQTLTHYPTCPDDAMDTAYSAFLGGQPVTYHGPEGGPSQCHVNAVVGVVLNDHMVYDGVSFFVDGGPYLGPDAGTAASTETGLRVQNLLYFPLGQNDPDYVELWGPAWTYLAAHLQELEDLYVG